MPLSAEDKQRIVELTSNAKQRRPRDRDDAQDFAGADATPLPVGYYRQGRRGNLKEQARRIGRAVAIAALPTVLILGGGGYCYRYDLHKMEFGALFDSTQGPSFIGRLREQVRLQKHKRELLDQARALGFANRHMAAVANTNKVLALDPDNEEARSLRATALDREVVSGRGALRSDDVDAAIASAESVLGQAPQHAGARALLQESAGELVDLARDAFETGNHEEAARLVRTAERIAPDFRPARQMHRRIVNVAVRRADERYIVRDYVGALDHIERVRLLEPNNPRAEALLEKIDERVGFPDISVNSVVVLGGEPRVVATIRAKTAMHSTGDTIGNVRITHIDPRSGEVRFEQIYTNEERSFVKSKTARGEWITPQSR